MTIQALTDQLTRHPTAFGAGLILLGLLLVGPRRAKFALTGQKRLFGDPPPRARGALPALLIGAGVGWLMETTLAAAVAGALTCLLVYYVARIAGRFWPLAILLAALVWLPFWFLGESAGRALNEVLRVGPSALPGVLTQTALFQMNFWPNRAPIWEALSYPPLWAAGLGAVGVILAGLRARGKR